MPPVRRKRSPRTALALIVSGSFCCRCIGSIVVVGVGLRMSLGATAEHAEAARLHAGRCIYAEGGHAELEEFADRGGSCRHAMSEPVIINGGQLFRREHDLKALGAKVVHGPSRNLCKMSSLLNERTRLGSTRVDKISDLVKNI